MHSILTQLRQQTNSFYSWINVFIFWVSVQSHVLGPVSQSNALYGTASRFWLCLQLAYWSMYAKRSPRLFACG